MRCYKEDEEEKKEEVRMCFVINHNCYELD